MRLATTLCFTLLPCLSSAEQDFGQWAQTNLGLGTDFSYAGQWVANDGHVFGIDPLTLFGANRAPISVPTTEAAVIGLNQADPDERTAILALVWSDAPFVCGQDAGFIGVDTGLAAFATASEIAALEKYARDHGDLYAGTYAEQIDNLYPGPFLAELPDGTRLPLSGSGWGDGGYPVTALFDADGDMIALFAQFITAGDDWLTPPTCTKRIS